MTEIPVISGEAVLATIDPATAIERTRIAFERYGRGEWGMPAKVYLDSPPHGDFRAMPARGDGLALLKWVTSFPGNSAKGLPVVRGEILLSDAATGEELAVIECSSVTSLRTGAAAAVSAQALAGELGWSVGDRAEAAQQDVVVTVTPGDEPVILASELRPGQHIAVLGADAHGKQEVELEAIARCRIFCDEWEQASAGGELSHAVEAGFLTRERVTQLGDVLSGQAEGRLSAEETTMFDSTGLAIQDLAIAQAVY